MRILQHKEEGSIIIQEDLIKEYKEDLVGFGVENN